MDSVLTRIWLEGLDALPVIDEASVSLCRQSARELGASLGLGVDVVERAALVASELAQNQIAHARLGYLAVRAAPRGPVPGLEIIAADRGPGIADPEAALAGCAPSAASLGVGLSGVRRAALEVDVDVRWGEGTCVRARLYGGPVDRRREIGVVGRPCEGESLSGDQAAHLRQGDALVVGVVDGLGHGLLARDAADLAVAELVDRASLSPASILDACDAALAGSRGAVMSVARLDEASGDLEHACVGNITTRLDTGRASRTFLSSSFALGLHGARRKRPAIERVVVDPSEALILFSDGLSSRTSLTADPDLVREHPVVVAQRLLEAFGRTNDDALVLVAR